MSMIAKAPDASVARSEDRRGRRPRKAYPSRSTIERIVDAARRSGIAVRGIIATPDGAIQVFESPPEKEQSEFERWQDQL